MRILVASIGLFACLAFPGISMADTRYGCMAQDEQVKLAVRIEFSEELGGKVAHLSGVFATQPAEAKNGLEQVRFDSRHLTQAWEDKGSVRMRLYNDAVAGGVVLLDISTEGAENATVLKGGYAIRQVPQSGPGIHLEGSIFCQINSMSVALAK